MYNTTQTLLFCLLLCSITSFCCSLYSLHSTKLYDMATKQHHILLLGGTGICGQLFTHAALLAGYKLTLYVRTPSKLNSDVASNKNVDILQGQLDDEEGLRKAANCGADVFISLAGPTLGRREGTVSIVFPLELG